MENLFFFFFFFFSVEGSGSPASGVKVRLKIIMQTQIETGVSKLFSLATKSESDLSGSIPKQSLS